MNNVFIVGCKGLPAQYGGFETFVDNLTKRKINKDIYYHVACLDDHFEDFIYNDSHCFKMKVKEKGSSRAMFADIIALKYIIEYVKNNNILNFTVLILASRIGIFYKKYEKIIHKLNGKLILNPDGFEWMRNKWNFFIKKYWKYSERKMVKYSDLIVCDSIIKKNYIDNKYKKYKKETKYIAYGADLEEVNDKDAIDFVYNFNKNKSIISNSYYLVVGRFVPENNYEIIIKEFMKSNTKKDLVIITSYENSKFYNELNNKLHFEKDKRIKFVGTVYNSLCLKLIRLNAYAYIHGHSVGGTNPSLLEAMAATKLNLLYDCAFNKEVAKNSAIYWNKENDSLKNIIDLIDYLDQDKIDNYSKLSKEIIYYNYRWEFIVDNYEKLFLEGK